MITVCRFLSRKQIQELVPAKNAVLISMFDPEQGPPTLQEGWLNVLPICCHDIDEVSAAEGNVDDAFKVDQPILFDSKMAASIIQFADNSREADVEQVYVHCHAGLSRSGAVALFLGSYLGVPVFNDQLPITMQYALYNKKVYATLNRVANGYV